jgi:hypothetical protein
LDDSLIIRSDILIDLLVIELEIQWSDDEEAEAEEEFGYRCCSKLTTAADNGIVCAVVNENVSYGKLYLRHEGGAGDPRMGRPRCCGTFQSGILL